MRPDRLEHGSDTRWWLPAGDRGGSATPKEAVSTPTWRPRQLQALPIEQREAIVTHLWGGLTFEQIAEVAGENRRARRTAGTRGRPDNIARKAQDLMPEQLRLREKIAALEDALAALAPAPVTLDRDRLMFRAGQAVSSRGRWIWPASTAALTVAASVLGLLLAFRPSRLRFEQTAAVERAGKGESRGKDRLRQR